MSDIGDWLNGLGLGRFAELFRDNLIDLDVLPDLNEADLEKLELPLGALLANLAESCEFAEAAELASALQLATQQRFDIVLLDIQMPGLDGPATLDLIRNSRASWSDVAVIALTANAMKGDEQGYLSSGFDGYVPKPVVQRDLLRKIADIMARGRPDIQKAIA